MSPPNGSDSGSSIERLRRCAVLGNPSLFDMWGRARSGKGFLLELACAKARGLSEIGLVLALRAKDGVESHVVLERRRDLPGVPAPSTFWDPIGGAAADLCVSGEARR